MLNRNEKQTIINYFLNDIDCFEMRKLSENHFQFNHKITGFARAKDNNIPGIDSEIYKYQFEYYKVRRVIRVLNLTSSEEPDNNIRISKEQSEWLHLKIS